MNRARLKLIHHFRQNTLSSQEPRQIKGKCTREEVEINKLQKIRMTNYTTCLSWKSEVFYKFHLSLILGLLMTFKYKVEWCVIFYKQNSSFIFYIFNKLITLVSCDTLITQYNQWYCNMYDACWSHGLWVFKHLQAFSSVFKCLQTSKTL